MTDFTLSSGSVVRPYRSPWGAFPTRGMAISSGVSSLAIRLGQLVISDTRTSTCEHKIKASVISGETGIVGIAAQRVQGSTAVADSECSVWEANPMVEFKGVTKGGTLVSSVAGSARTLAWDSSLGINYVDLGGSTVADNRVLVTQLLDAVGDSGGYVAFRFLATERLSSINSTIAFLTYYGR